MSPSPPNPSRSTAPAGWLARWRRWWGLAPREASAHDAARPSPRRRQRERVALLVREIMIRHGVLSSRYRVRVLSLDREGLQHLVLIDWLPHRVGLAAGPVPEAARLEAEVQTEARQTLGLEVRAVYWRGNPLPGGRPPHGQINGPRS